MNLFHDLTPEEWPIATLGQLEEDGVLWIKNGFAQGEHNQEGTGVPHLRPFNVSSSGEITLSHIKYVPSPGENDPRWLAIGDVIFNNTNSEELVGKTAYFKQEGRFVLSNHMTIIRILDSATIDAYWLAKMFHWLWLQRVFQAICRRHVNQASVSLARLQQVEIPLPPLPEQRAIARVLTTVREAIEATDRVLTAARELKRSLMHHLFTYGPVQVNEADQVSLKETEIGDVPEGWEVKELGELCEFTQYGTSQRCSETPVGYAVLRIPNVIGGKIDISDLKYTEMPQSTADNLKLMNGDVIFVRTNGQRAYVGRSAVFKDELPNTLFASYLIRIRLERETVLPEFVQGYTETNRGRSYLSGRATGAADGKFNINSQTIKTVGIPVPSINEQNKIVKMLAECQKKIEVEENRKTALESLFQSLLHNLMTGKLRTLYPAPDYFIPTREPAYAVRETDPEVHVEALLIAALVNAQYQVSQHPVSRFRVTKLSYLYNSFTNRQEALENFGIYNFGPYNPQIRYGGVEETSVALGYLEKVDETHFQPGAQMGKAVQLASEYYDPARIAQIIEEFGEFRDRTLELWTTVEFTARQIYAKGEFVSAEHVFEFWRENVTWHGKTEKFTIEELRNAIQGLRNVFNKFR